MTKNFWTKSILIFSTLLVFGLTFVPTKPALADSTESYFDKVDRYGIIFADICIGDDCPCRDQGECTLTDMMQVFVNIANFILAICGSLALLFFMYGGLLWLTSQGSSEKIDQGQHAMQGAFVGLLIIFGAFAGINFLTGALRSGDAGQTNKCELVSPENGGKSGLGYACLDINSIDTSNYNCESNLCPGPDEIKCCRPK